MVHNWSNSEDWSEETTCFNMFLHVVFLVCPGLQICEASFLTVHKAPQSRFLYLLSCFPKKETTEQTGFEAAKNGGYQNWSGAAAGP